KKDRYVKISKVQEFIEELDEPQKVKVPKCVGELLDYYRNSTDVDLLALLITFKDWYFRKDKLSENEEAIDWLVRHPEKFMKAWLDGYEVEEEPRWVVKKREDSYFKSFTGIDFRSSSAAYEDYAYSFTDKSKAEAVATLIDGSVEEV
ncbi:DUF1642 domain-containing protein, partial [Enterococcus avium]|uniref:DUF1642 domain-containing protein n=1 Tax=Enterococcus avium TaxID=33945 RepID=UPI002891D6B9